MRIDAHAHVGEDLARKKLGMPSYCDPELLAKAAKANDVTDIIVAPCPGFVVCEYFGQNGHENIYGIQGVPVFITPYKDNMTFQCNCGELWVSREPYVGANQEMFAGIENASKYDVKSHPLLIIHPDDPELSKTIQKYHNENRIIGLKWHQLATRTDPLNYLDKDWVKLVRDLDLPILFHTDADEYSRPEKVVEFSKETGIRCQLAHGARFNKTSLNACRDNPSLVVDLTPIYFLLNNRDRHVESGINFQDYVDLLEYVIAHAGIENVVMGSDFAWNVWGREERAEELYAQDWEVFEEACKKSGYPIDLLVHDNAARFWKL